MSLRVIVSCASLVVLAGAVPGSLLPLNSVVQVILASNVSLGLRHCWNLASCHVLEPGNQDFNFVVTTPLKQGPASYFSFRSTNFPDQFLVSLVNPSGSAGLAVPQLPDSSDATWQFVNGRTSTSMRNVATGTYLTFGSTNNHHCRSDVILADTSAPVASATWLISANNNLWTFPFISWTSGDRTRGTHPACGCFDAATALGGSFAPDSGEFGIELPAGSCSSSPGVFSGTVSLTWNRSRADHRRMFFGEMTVGDSVFAIRGRHAARPSARSWTVKIGVPGKLDSGSSNFCRYTFTSVGYVRPEA